MSIASPNPFSAASPLSMLTADVAQLSRQIGTAFPLPGLFGPLQGLFAPTGSAPQSGTLAGALKDLANALKDLADALGGLNTPRRSQPGTQPGTPATPAPSLPQVTPPAPTPSNGVIAGTGRIWGDPHFIGADGDHYDVQGEAGKTYNLLSDAGFQMNGRFDKFGDGGATIVGEVGITLPHNYISVNKTGKVEIDGAELLEGQRRTLGGGGYAEKKDGKVVVQSGEWKVDFQFDGSAGNRYINMDVSTKNALSDGVRPHGLLGQTFDGDGIARNGDAGGGAQGGGVIQRLDGTVTQRGDKSAVSDYEVSGIFDYQFTKFNRETYSAYGNMLTSSVLPQAGSNFNYGFYNANANYISQLMHLGNFALVESLLGNVNYGMR